MSLINNMLNDLERRQADDFSDVNPVIADLEGIDEMSLQESKSESSSIIVLISLFLFLLFLVLIQSSFHLNEHSLSQWILSIKSFYSSQFNDENRINNLIQNNKMEIPEKAGVSYEYTNEQLPVAYSPEEILSLELDNEFLSLDIPVSHQEIFVDESQKTISKGQKVYGVEYALIDKQPNIFISMSHEPHYRINMLDSPDRLLIEFNEIKDIDEIDELFLNKPDFITAQRSKKEDEVYGYILEFNQPLKLMNTSHSQYHDKFLLRIVMDFINPEIRSVDESEKAGLKSDISSSPSKKDILPNFTQVDSMHFLQQSSPSLEDEPEVVIPQTINKIIHEKDGVLTSDELYQNALEHYQNGLLDQSISELQQSLKENPDNISARMLLAEIYMSTRDRKNTIQLLIAGLDRDLGNSHMAKLCAQLLQQEGNNQLAIMYLQAAKPEVVNDPEYIALLAALMQRESRHKEAINHYQELLQFNSQQGVWWMGLAISFEGIGARSQALQAYLRARNDAGLAPDLIDYIQQRIFSLQS